MLSTATGIIGNSRDTLDSLQKYAESEGLPYPPSTVAWLGFAPLPSPARSVASPSPYFVVLGTIEGRKNHALLLRVWQRLAKSLGSEAPELRIIGQRGWNAEHVHEQLDAPEHLGGRVVELGNCSDRELGAQLEGARALLFPSLAEGFGLPLVEALSVGTPVIASDLPVFREIGAGVPTLIDPENEDEWEAAVMEFSRSCSGERQRQLRRIRGLNLPSWNAHFARVEAFLEELKLDGASAAVRGSQEDPPLSRERSREGPH